MLQWSSSALASCIEAPGLISDYFSEVLHRLRGDDYSAEYRNRLRFDCEEGSITTRDEEALIRMLNGLAKFLYPHRVIGNEELLELATLAARLRNRVTGQQHLMERVQGGRTLEFPKKTIVASLID